MAGVEGCLHCPEREGQMKRRGPTRVGQHWEAERGESVGKNAVVGWDQLGSGLQVREEVEPVSNWVTTSERARPRSGEAKGRPGQ